MCDLLARPRGFPVFHTPSQTIIGSSSMLAPAVRGALFNKNRPSGLPAKTFYYCMVSCIVSIILILYPGFYGLIRCTSLVLNKPRRGAIYIAGVSTPGNMKRAMNGAIDHLPLLTLTTNTRCILMKKSKHNNFRAVGINSFGIVETAQFRQLFDHHV